MATRIPAHAAPQFLEVTPEEIAAIKWTGNLRPVGAAAERAALRALEDAEPRSCPTEPPTFDELAESHPHFVAWAIAARAKRKGVRNAK